LIRFGVHHIADLQDIDLNLTAFRCERDPRPWLTAAPSRITASGETTLGGHVDAF